MRFLCKNVNLYNLVITILQRKLINQRIVQTKSLIEKSVRTQNGNEHNKDIGLHLGDCGSDQTEIDYRQNV